jgi:hypothetical protein
LGRVIHTTNPTRQRAAIIKRMASLLKEYPPLSKTENKEPELAASLVISLQEIRDSVNQTAEAWEKRDYWVKADAFRRQWNWIESNLAGLAESLETGNSADVRKRILELKQSVDSKFAA